MKDVSGSAAASTHVHVDIVDQVATLLLDRPAKLHALTLEMLDELWSAVGTVAASDARVAVIRSSGDRAFCVGADVTRFGALSPVEMWREWTARGHRVFNALATLRQPTVAVLHGQALGGGLELALACDFRILAADARVGLPEVGLGTIPGWGGTNRLTALVGPARAKEMVLGRRIVDAETAHAWGLATDVVPTDELNAAVDELVARLVGGAPIAVQLAKQLIDAGVDNGQSHVLDALAGGLAAATEDAAEGVASFVDRREPKFRGR